MANEVQVLLSPLKGGHPPAAFSASVCDSVKVSECLVLAGNQNISCPTNSVAPRKKSLVNFCCEDYHCPCLENAWEPFYCDTHGVPIVKAGGMRISKKQEFGVLERHTRKTGFEKTSAIANVAKIQTMDALNDTLEKLSHKFPVKVHMAHQKPRPALEKVVPLKRIYIIQQPRKC